jgi:hypothetical protein
MGSYPMRNERDCHASRRVGIILRTAIITLLAIAVVAFYSRFLIALLKEWKPSRASPLSSSMQPKKAVPLHISKASTPQREDFQSKGMVRP